MKQSVMQKWKEEHPKVKLGELRVIVYVHNKPIGCVKTNNLHCFKRHPEYFKYSYQFVEE